MKIENKKALKFLLSQSITLLGSSVVQFAMIWYVTKTTSSGAWTSALTVAAYVPQLIISFFAGVWADRYPKRKLIILSDSAIAVATLALAILMPFIGEGTPLLWSLIVISVIRSLGAGIQTPAVNSAIPLLVPEEKLMKFNGANSTAQSLIQFVAPLIAGTLLSFSSLGSALMIDILTAVVGIAVLITVTIPFTKEEKTTSVFGDIKDGLKYAVKMDCIGKLLLLFGMFIFLCVPSGFLNTLFVTRYYGDTYWYMTLIEVVGFIGMFGGGIMIGGWGGFKNRVITLSVGILSFGILAVFMGAIDNLVIYLILMAFYGVALVMAQTATTTLLQENTEPGMQGRMFGLLGSMFSGFLPLGMAIFGPLSDVISLRIIMIISGGLLVIMAIGIITSKKFRSFGIKVQENNSIKETEKE